MLLLLRARARARARARVRIWGRVKVWGRVRVRVAARDLRAREAAEVVVAGERLRRQRHGAEVNGARQQPTADAPRRAPVQGEGWARLSSPGRGLRSMVALTLADRPSAHGPEHAPLGGRRSREQKVAVRLAHGISQRVRRGRRVHNAEHAHLSHTVTDSITRGYSLIHIGLQTTALIKRR